MRISIPILIFLALLAGQDYAGPVDVPPYIHVDVSVATEGPVSLFCAPDGSGTPFTEACGPGGTVVDATITLILYDDFGQPVPGYPREDLWLEGTGGGLISCYPGGTCPDAHTDANGTTRWTSPLSAAGHTAPGEGLVVVVNGDFPEGGSLPDFRTNSSDINADGQVNLSDVEFFAVDFHGSYDYRSDFLWDGDVNLSDVVFLARTLGAQCP